MKGRKMPNVSGIQGVVVALYVFAVLGALRLIALSHPDATASKAFLMLY